MKNKSKYFYQHDLDRILLTEKFTKTIFDKAIDSHLGEQKMMPHMNMDDLHKVRHKLKLYSYVPIYNKIGNRQ